MAQALATPVAPSLSLICTTSSSFKSKSASNSLSFSTFNPPKVGGLSIRCARVGGVEIPNNKRVQYSLQYIHGIGRTRALEILNDLKMENKITKDLSEEELIILRDEVSKYMIEGDLRRFNALAIRRLKEIQAKRLQLLAKRRPLVRLKSLNCNETKFFYIETKLQLQCLIS
ncbi:unnamed protein product [Lactuca saligna]|uniref:30S ribosomal protein S13, chloroplastic n=1 Tax=Lactuca saligna TaxID=75948 RepID=A0AA35VI13_LACSI|nr:unnamed protein product [Lactuca saligna]